MPLYDRSLATILATSDFFDKTPVNHTLKVNDKVTAKDNSSSSVFLVKRILNNYAIAQMNTTNEMVVINLTRYQKANIRPQTEKTVGSLLPPRKGESK